MISEEGGEMSWSTLTVVSMTVSFSMTHVSQITNYKISIITLFQSEIFQTLIYKCK
jgi:hypothetical protein